MAVGFTFSLGAPRVACRSVAPGSGFYSSLANSTVALQIWPEHRYYAEAEPYTPADDFAHFTIVTLTVSGGPYRTRVVCSEHVQLDHQPGHCYWVQLQ